KQL
ncbi:mannose-6-phosphate isomerase, class I, partial [Vibrio parahaemolyticus VPTS-2010_2]